jgi:hypothetical protein
LIEQQAWRGIESCAAQLLEEIRSGFGVLHQQ